MNEMRIGELRRLRGWTQERLAENSGIAVRTVQRIERGSDASLESLSAIARALEVPVRELFAVDDTGEQTLNPEVRGLGDRMDADQANRDNATRGWRHLYGGVGTIVTLAVIALIGAGSLNGTAIFIIPAYWAGGGLLFRFLITAFVEPRLDRRYPLSRTRGSWR